MFRSGVGVASCRDDLPRKKSAARLGDAAEPCEAGEADEPLAFNARAGALGVRLR